MGLRSISTTTPKDIRTIERIQSALQKKETDTQKHASSSHAHAMVSEWWPTLVSEIELSEELDEQQFQRALKACTDEIDTRLDSISTIDDETTLSDEKTIQDAMRLILTKISCHNLEPQFARLSLDLAGTKHVQRTWIEDNLRVHLCGTPSDRWMYACRVLDADQDGCLTKSECHAVYMRLLDMYKHSVIALFMDKVFDPASSKRKRRQHRQQLQRALQDTEWNAKVMEKIRCVWHFALENEKITDDGRLSVEQLHQSQQREFENFDTFLLEYLNGYHQSRTNAHAKRQERRKTIRLGFLFTIAIGIIDYSIIRM